MKKLTSQLLNLLNEKAEKDLIVSAINFADTKHKGQFRKSGDPYIVHPLNVALNLAKDGFDIVAVISAILHDCIEDTDTTYKELESIFSKEIANIVDGVTKISTITLKNKDRLFSDDEMFLGRVDNYRKILLATTTDLRVIIIKLYDRLHNIETIEFLPKEKRKFYARETIEIFAPIAERLGMGELKGQLEDLSFPFAYPNEYEEFIQTAHAAYKNPQNVIQSVIPNVKNALCDARIKYTSISGRAKHLYSLYLKSQKKDLSLIFDIVALRVIVENIEDCYKTLGVIHSLYVPVPSRIHDYIARPKDNGYQSLHTTIKDESGNVFEIQIRTEEMHKIAEYGSPAHWSYKEDQSPKSSREWLDELKKIEQIKSGKVFIQTIKEELFSKRAFIFTPKGDIIDLPSGSCGIDFAYRIHTDVGNKCKGVRINGRLAPLRTKLETGDIVEIITSTNTHPSKDWLSFVKTQAAKSKIRNELKEATTPKFLQKGQRIIEELIKEHDLPQLNKDKAELMLINSRLPFNNLNGALIALGEGHVKKIDLLKILYPSFSTNARRAKPAEKNNQTIFTLKGIRHVIAGCCKPTPRDNIIGYLTKEHIIKVHKVSCKRISKVDTLRLIKI